MRIGARVYEVTEDLLAACTVTDLSSYAGHVSDMLVDFVCRLATDADLVPMTDLSSHLELLDALRIAEAMGISREQLTRRLGTWTAKRTWICLKRADYMYELSREYPALVDYDRYFAESETPFAHLAGAIKAAHNPDRLIEMLTFYSSFDFAACFAVGDETSRARIEWLRDERAAVGMQFLIDPHAPIFNGYWTRIHPDDNNVWSCEGIAREPALEIGSPVMCDLATFNERLSKFTMGLLERPQSQADAVWPHANVIISGGSVMRMLSGSPANHAADVDIFICGASHEQRAQAFEQVIAWFKGPNTYYAINGSVVTVYVKNIRRKIQVISINSPNRYAVIARFDLTHIQWGAYWSGDHYTVFGTAAAATAIRTRVTYVCNELRVKANRLVKALYAGYAVSKRTDLDITTLISEPNQVLDGYLRELHAFYYPVDVPDLSPEDERQHILCMIERDSKATSVTADAARVHNDIVIDGNFGGGYESTSFAMFNPASIKNIAHALTRFALHDGRGRIRLSTPCLRVTNVLVRPEGVSIEVETNDEFTAFCDVLETRVWPIFRRLAHYDIPAAPDRKIINNGKIILELSRFRIDGQEVRGTSLLVTQRGVALNIEEDLARGDQLTTTFYIVIERARVVNAISLIPIFFVKRDERPVQVGAPVYRAQRPVALNNEIRYEQF